MKYWLDISWRIALAAVMCAVAAFAVGCLAHLIWNAFVFGWGIAS